MKSIGIVGCGSIGQSIITAVRAGDVPVRVGGVSTRTPERVADFFASMADPPPVLERDELIAASDLVIEAAGGHVVSELARATFAEGKDLMVISIGAILNDMAIMDIAHETGCRLILPSGAIAGLDAVKAACEGPVDFVRLTSRKPPRALVGAPFVVKNGIDVEGLTEERLLFSGPAREAVAGFPDNLNVSAALSLAGIGPDATEVRISAVPGLMRNCHDIEVEGYFGSLHIHLENIPSENPKTGRLTALSIIRAIKQETDSVAIGT